MHIREHMPPSAIKVELIEESSHTGAFLTKMEFHPWTSVPLEMKPYLYSADYIDKRIIREEFTMLIQRKQKYTHIDETYSREYMNMKYILLHNICNKKCSYHFTQNSFRLESSVETFASLLGKKNPQDNFWKICKKCNIILLNIPISEERRNVVFNRTQTLSICFLVNNYMKNVLSHNTCIIMFSGELPYKK